jgi:hypothetical protein
MHHRQLYEEEKFCQIAVGHSVFHIVVSEQVCVCALIIKKRIVEKNINIPYMSLGNGALSYVIV